MAIFIASFVVIILAVIAMAVGVLFGRPAIKGSCGGLNQIGLTGNCSGACSTRKRALCTRHIGAMDSIVDKIDT